MEFKVDTLQVSIDPRQGAFATVTAGEPPLPQSWREREHASTVAGIIVLTSPDTLDTAIQKALP